VYVRFVEVVSSSNFLLFKEPPKAALLFMPTLSKNWVKSGKEHDDDKVVIEAHLVLVLLLFRYEVLFSLPLPCRPRWQGGLFLFRHLLQ
jgi:hypothetical protein